MTAAEAMAFIEQHGRGSGLAQAIPGAEPGHAGAKNTDLTHNPVVRVWVDAPPTTPQTGGSFGSVVVPPLGKIWVPV